ncbi:hypothetical protein DSM107010_14820 [Chroococcidiopsis cubana SAG 39.79]|uniref:NERD domain-containing protein n=2 Tax=Chroococcidiopsis TaxID=54298 RepID=A0AB37UPA7_9CYAN|nr:hypothetical protein [Chroococcidiopsis cubana]RUT13220.1 hypothetical protein DSM107010_14820 [Chroococcidiopsis cubana SAG 39.79]
MADDLLVMVNVLEEFVSVCRTEIQPDAQKNIINFFKAVVPFPYDKELFLHTYLYLNIHQIFPECQELLLFEKSPLKGRTDLGKCDFVYLADKGILFLIETKYIDTEATGSTARNTRKEHRKKVFEQVIKLRNAFSQFHNLRSDLFKCGIFTTDIELQKDIRDFNRRQPFIPYRIHIKGGQTYDIRHPDRASVLRSRIIIGIDGENGTADRALTYSSSSYRAPSRTTRLY